MIGKVFWSHNFFIQLKKLHNILELPSNRRDLARAIAPQLPGKLTQSVNSYLTPVRYCATKSANERKTQGAPSSYSWLVAIMLTVDTTPIFFS